MSRRHRSISVPVDTYVEVDVDDVLDELTNEELHEIVLKRAIPPGLLVAGEGDDSRLRGIVDGAERAIRRMQNAPRELLDLMYHVHGRAIA